jgi:uncharacterized protein YndB with AHSA1/START domain
MTTADGTMQQTGDAYVLRFERHIDHPIDRVWAAISTTQGIAAWLGKASVELTRGGRVRLQFDKTVGNVITGRVTEVDPPRVLAYTFGEEDPPSILRWELSEAHDRQGTTLVLTHTLPTPEHGASALAGWHTLLDIIPAAIAGEDPQWSKKRWDEVHAEYEAAIA